MTGRIIVLVTTLVTVLSAGAAQAQDPPVVTNLTTGRVQWRSPVAELTATDTRPALGYFDYKVDNTFIPSDVSEIVRMKDASGNFVVLTVDGVAYAVWQAKLPPTLTEGRHSLGLRSCEVGAKDPDVDCSAWMAVDFEVDAVGDVRPTAPSGITFINIGVTVNVTSRP